MQVEEKSHQHQGVFDHSLGEKVEDDQFRTLITEENHYFILGHGGWLSSLVDDSGWRVMSVT